MNLLIRSLAGAALAVVIHILSRTNNYYLAGLAPLFPTFAIMAHFVIEQERTTAEFRETILFGIFSLIPYLVYLGTLYMIVDRLEFGWALWVSVLAWLVVAVILIAVWQRI